MCGQMGVIREIPQELMLIYLSCQDNTYHVSIGDKTEVVNNAEKRLGDGNCFLMRCSPLLYEKQLVYIECVPALIFAGRSVPHVAGGDGSEVCVVISGQHQGQVYLCDAANLGSSARC